jgi:hypothetical protein
MKRGREEVRKERRKETIYGGVDGDRENVGMKEGRRERRTWC